MNIEELKREIEEKKKEARKLLDTDLEKAKELTKEVKELREKLELKQQIEDEEMKELQRQKKEKEKEKEGSTEERALKDTILPGEKFSDILASEKSEKGYIYSFEEDEERNYQNLRLDKLVRGMAGKGWDGANEERNYYRSMTSATNSTLIPQDLANKIIDVARTNSAIFGRIPTVPMEENNLTIAVQTKDPVANFIVEGNPITESEPVFSKVIMEGKTLAIFIPVTEQLLECAENLESQLINSCAKAIALELDKALLYGTGEEGQIKGISLYENINKVPHRGVANYDMFIKGIKETKKSNITPTDIAYSTDTGMDLAMLKDSNGQYISRPKVLEQYTFTESNNVKINESYIYDYNSLLLGIHKNVTIKWGEPDDYFQRIMKGLRVYIRTDLAVINPKGITQITVTP